MRHRNLCIYTVLILLVISVSILATFFAYVTYMDVHTVRYHADYTIGNYVGFNISLDDIIHFGTVPPGMGAERVLILTTDEPAFITVLVEDLHYVSPARNNFYLEEAGNYTLTLNLKTPGDIPFGRYNGSIFVTSRKRPALFS